MNVQTDIENLLEQLQIISPEAFLRFDTKHRGDIFDPDGSTNWFFPKLYDFYTNEDVPKEATEVVKKIGILLHEECNGPFAEITKLDKSLCLDESIVLKYVRECQKLTTGNTEYKELRSPYKTKSYVMGLTPMYPFAEDYLMVNYSEVKNPYILSDIAARYSYGGNMKKMFDFLYRSAKMLLQFPNMFWNSELALVGATNTFRLLRLMCDEWDIENYRRLFKYSFVYLTRLLCIVEDDLLEQTAYLNRAELVSCKTAYTFLPFGHNPDLFYISDLYFAHFCNDYATLVSAMNGNYYMKSLTYYRNGSIYPNTSGGYVDILDVDYESMVKRKNKDAIKTAYLMFEEIKGHDRFTNNGLNELFDILRNKYENNVKLYH